MVNNRALYDLSIVKTCIVSGFEIVNKRARKSYKELGWNSATLLALVQALCSRHYRGPRYAQQSEIGELDVDLYVICFNEDSLVEDRLHGLEFSIKLALADGDPSTVIVSFHLSGQP